MRRREFLMTSTAALAAPATRAAAEGATVPSLKDAARDLATRPFARTPAVLPPPFAGLDYDSYRGIRPIPGKAAMLPVGVGFAVDLLPPGLFFPDPLHVEILSEDGLRTVPFSPAVFDFDPRYFGAIPDSAPGAGFTGLRLRYPLNAPDRLDEVLVLQGASYFRAIGPTWSTVSPAGRSRSERAARGPRSFPPSPISGSTRRWRAWRGSRR
jgi:periplasmic glucans biosynthesis protein